MQKSTFVIATLLLVCMLAVCTAGAQLSKQETQSIQHLFTKIVDDRVEKLIQKIERRNKAFQEQADASSASAAEESLLTHFLRIVDKVGLPNTKKLIVSALELIDKSKVKFITSADFVQMSDETLAGYFFQILGQIGEDAFRSVFKVIDRLVGSTPPPPQASRKYKPQGDFSEMSDEGLLGYFWDVVSQIGFDAAKKIFDTIVKITGYDMPIPGQASNRYKKNREQADMAFGLIDFKQLLIKAFPNLAEYINTHWDVSKNTMNFKEFYNLAFNKL